MNVSVSSNASISFTEQEKDILTKAKDILKQVGDKLWQSDNDDVMDLGCYFTDVSYNIKDILEENY